MKIGLDFDGVISDCGKLKREGALRLYGKDIPEEKFKKEIVVGQGILTSDEYRNLQKQIYGTKELGLLMKEVEGVMAYINKLKEEGHEIFVVTSRNDGDLEIAKEWIRAHPVELQFHGCVGSKLSKCLELGLDIFVDDDLDKLESLEGNVRNLFLFTWGYNSDVPLTGSVKRVADWNDLYDRISTIQ